MSSRRGHTEGSIFVRKDGRWAGILDLGNVGGRRRRRTVYARSQREVIAKLASARRNAADGLSLDGGQETLGRYVQRWLEQRDPRTRSAGVRKLAWTTWSSYESRLRLHVLPTLGSIPLAKIQPDHVRELIARLSASELSATSVSMVRDTLATVLERCTKDRLIVFNPLHGVDTVRRSKPRTYVMSADQARAIIRAAADDPYEAVFVLALHCGLRASELFGLKWGDLSLERAELKVSRALVRVRGAGLQTFDPKTKSSAATIPLTSTAVAALRQHQIRQKEQRLAVGPSWQETGFVFVTEVGTPVSQSNFLRRHFYPVALRAGLPVRRRADGTQGVRLHDCRHATGTLLVSAGVSLKLVQTILRHSKLSTTADIYTHALPADLRVAVATLDRAIS